jgi:cell division protein FtsB
MDDQDDDKKRVLTPPSEWADGMKPSEPPQLVDDFDEDTDWLDEDDFASPDEDTADDDWDEEADGSEEAISDEDYDDYEDDDSPSEADALLADHREASRAPEKKRMPIVPWSVAGVLLLALAGVTGKWLDDRSTAEKTAQELQASLLAAQRNTGVPEAEAQALRDENQALKAEVSVLEEQYAQAMKEVSDTKNQIDALALKTANDLVQGDRLDAAQRSYPVQSGGLWFVNVESHTDSGLANQRMREIDERFTSISFETVSARVNGRIYHRIRAAGFSSQAEATEASKIIAGVLGNGPLWVGRDKSPQARVQPTSKKPADAQRVVTSQPEPKTIRLKNMSRRENWFVFVETFDEEPKADAVASDLIDKGWDAKVAVESRSGELFYRVQVVGIDDERMGNAIVAELRSSGDFGNARLRKAI